MVLEALLPAIRLVVVVGIAKVVRVRCKALCELLLACRGCLLHGRAAECPALSELGRKLHTRTLKVRISDIPVGVIDDTIKIRVRTGKGTLLGIHIEPAAEDGVERTALHLVALRAEIGVVERLILAV